MQKPPLELPAIHTTASAPPGYEPAWSPAKDHRHSGMFSQPLNSSRYQQVLQNFITPLDNEYQTKSALIPQSIEADLAATRLEGSTQPLPPSAAIVRELGVRNTVIQRKTAELQRQTTISHGFYGSDPTSKNVFEFLSRAAIVDRVLSPNGPGMRLWQQSYRAAYEARLLTQTITVLNQQHVNVLNWLAAVQADEQARLAAQQQAQRLAAELERQAVEAQARRVEAERARVAAEVEGQRIAAEQARFAALAEAQRLANEQAQAAAQAAAQHIAAEQARLAQLAEIQRLAEQTRLETERQKNLREAERLYLDALKSARTYPASGVSAASGPAFSFALTGIALASETSIAIITALRSALVIAGNAALTMAGPVLVGFAALLAPSRLGNSDRLALSLPLSELAHEQGPELLTIAAEHGETELPVQIGFRQVGTSLEAVVITTGAENMPSSVPVRLATFDAQHNVYRVAPPDSPASFLTWTPAITPDNSSTQLPVARPELPTYPGASVVPVVGRIDLSPMRVEGWENFITVFPDDSGIPPLYVVFSSPYDGATTKGEHSDRAYNPEQAGGPIEELDWSTATITQEGVDEVRLHIARLDQSDANDIMVERLEKILSGDLDISDTDRRYYTHEIRELERFRAMGLSDYFKPENGSPAWNNAHTATLEDYKLSDDERLLYSNEAIQAGDKQINRIYEQRLKGAFE